MSLITPPFYFGSVTHNHPAAIPGTNIGTLVTLGASSSDGSAVASGLGVLAHDVHYLTIGVTGTTASAENDNTLIDILIDPAGGTSWASFIDDLVCGFNPEAANSTIAQAHQIFHFPIYIKAGATLGLRGRRQSSATKTVSVLIHAYGDPSRPDMWWCGAGVESLGANAASSQGTALTPSNGSWSAWTSVGGATSHRYGAVQFGVQGSDNTSQTSCAYWEIGVGSQKVPGTPTYWMASHTNEVNCRLGQAVPTWCDIPAGSQMQMRAYGGSGTQEAFNAMIYGVY